MARINCELTDCFYNNNEGNGYGICSLKEVYLIVASNFEKTIYCNMFERNEED